MSGIKKPKLPTNIIDFQDDSLNKVEIKLTIDYPGSEKETCRGDFFFDDLLVYSYAAKSVRSVAYEAQEILNKLIVHPVDLRLSLSLIDTEVSYKDEPYVVKFWSPDTGLLSIIPAQIEDDEEPEPVEIDFLSDFLVW